MKRYMLAELAAYLETPIRGAEYVPDEPSFHSVSTDTRSIEAEALFIALRGVNFDAHDFLGQAADTGALSFLVSDEEAVLALPEAKRRPYLLVEDTEVALLMVAKWYRSKITGQVVGITGSVGKTSTRQMVKAALDRSLKVTATKANNNNHIGLARTILACEEQTAVLIVEMGIDRPGDMLRLADMAEPNIAIVTGIGVSHIAQFKTREAILEAKLEIREGIREGGHLLLNGDNDLIMSCAQDIVRDIPVINGDKSYEVSFISADPEQAPTWPSRCFLAKHIRSDFEGSVFDCWEQEPGEVPVPFAAQVVLPVPGRHQIQNSLFALQVADILGVRAEAAKESLQDFEASGDRQRLMEARGVTMINDSYNASPESMKAALDLLVTLSGDRRRLVALGGMNELGDMAEKLHFNLGLDIARADVDYAWICGPYADHVEGGIHALKPDCPVLTFPDREALEHSLIPQLEDRDILLIKASRSFAMEKLAEAIVRERLTPDVKED